MPFERRLAVVYCRKQRPSFSSDRKSLYMSKTINEEIDSFSSYARRHSSEVESLDVLHALPNRPCGSAIVSCIHRLSERTLPQRVLDIASYYATNDPDPNSDIWQDKVNGQNYYGSDPHEHGSIVFADRRLKLCHPFYTMTRRDCIHFGLH